MNTNIYENFRAVLTMNLCNVITNNEILKNVMQMVDITMNDFEISKKPTELTTTTGVPDVVKYYIASKAVSNMSKNTLKQYGYKLINFFKTMNKSYLDITSNDIRVYLYNYKIAHNASDCYMDCIRITLNTFFQWLVDNEYMQKNPCATIEKIRFQPKERQPVSTLTLEELRWNCTSIRDKALIDFLFSTGCRVSECTDVLLEDINWEHNSVVIRHGKGNKRRTVYFNDESKVTLREYIKSRSDKNPALWVSSKKPHQQLQSHAIENIIKKIGERTGVHVYPHRLRHTFATIGLRNGMPLEKLQSLMGHTNPNTTLIYAKLDDTQTHMEHLKAFC